MNGQWCELPTVRTCAKKSKGGSAAEALNRTRVEQAFDILAIQVAGMNAEETPVFLLPAPKRCSSHTRARGKVRIASLVQHANENAKCLRDPLHGFHLILALPQAGGTVAFTLPDNGQEGLSCALIGQYSTHSGQAIQEAPAVKAAVKDKEESPWPTAKLDYTQFNAWVQSAGGAEAGGRRVVSPPLLSVFMPAPRREWLGHHATRTVGAPVMVAAEHRYRAHNTRERPTTYRELAGICSRTPGQRANSSEPPPSPPELSPGKVQPTSTNVEKADLPKSLEWALAHSKCPIFRGLYSTAAQQTREFVQGECKNCQLNFRYVPPYLRVCIHGIWRTCVRQLSEFLTHALHSHHDHVPAGHRGQKKTSLALSKHNYWPEMRAYNTAYVESCTHCCTSKSLKQKPGGILLQIPSSRWNHVSLDFITDMPLTTTGYDSILLPVNSLSKLAHFPPAKKSFTVAETVELHGDCLIHYHGFPEALISGRGARFQ
ncbi:hypothetical protein EBH_0033510 [Eimeria brunetti]|uniref:Integrase zinc-binding domain-containing protein n=1 Tax=Eimeria brunetti TaxID=51314 RepID=U6LJA7_9EIME|nr:hypothetical protein EBH_0033510 [Eimeria brunetti]